MGEGDRKPSKVRRPEVDDARLSAALPYVPRVLVDSLATCEESGFPWSAEVDGTLVMGDISGFTAMSEQLAKAGKEGAEQLTDIITSFFTSMLDKARAFGGDIITYGGDAMLLLFSGKDHERRAVSASLDMLDEMRALPPFRVGRTRIPLGMSMGAHSDSFPIFGAGTPYRAQFFILGPATVKTAECEALADSGELVVSAQTLKRCSGLVSEEVGDGLYRVGSLSPKPAPDPALAELSGACRPEPLLPYLPPFAARAIDAGDELPKLDSDHRKVSIVFVNVLGVDDLLAEGRDALASELQAYSAVVIDVLARHDGYLVSNDIYTNGFKFIIAFGAPVALEGDAEKAVRFSIELRDKIEQARLRLTQRIGINRGDVFAGDVGPEYRRQYTVMGDAVNLAARLMSAAEAHTAMTTFEVAKTAGPCFSSAVLDPIRVKGKSHPIDVCLLQTETASSDLAAVGFGREPFVGREAEMSVVARAADRAHASGRGIVAILGDPGSGKSRLVAEEVRKLEESGWKVAYGSSHQHTAAMPFTPWVEILGRLMGLHECASSEKVAERVRATVERYALRAVSLACLLGQLLDVAIEETDHSRSLDPASRREALFELVRAVIEGSTLEQPLCLVHEDMHWADASSMDLLAHLASSPPSQARLLVLATCRTEAEAQSALRATATDVVDLAELADEPALTLVSASLGVQIPREFADLLLRKSKGNPLFLQEVARSVAQTGVLDRIRAAASTVAAAEILESIDIPDGVQALLMSRIDRLEPSRRELLRTASVIGSTFTIEDVVAIADDEYEQMPAGVRTSRIDDLVASQFLEPVGERTGDAGQLRFTLPLLQEVTYNSLRFARRRALHRKYAYYLERLPDRDARLGALVHHSSRCGEWQKTSLYGVMAAQRAADLFAHREAVDYSHVALGAIRGSTPSATWERSCVAERIGDEHESWGHHRDAIRSYKNALTRWERIESVAGLSVPRTQLAALLIQTPSASRRAMLCRKIGTSFERSGRQYDLADQWLDRALAALPKACTAERAAIFTRKGFVATRLGRYEDSIRFGRRALADARSCGDRSQRANALMALYAGYDGTGELEKGIECQLEAVAILEELQDLPKLVVGHGNLAVCYTALGRLDAARREHEISLELDERMGSVSGAAIGRVNLAEVLIQQGHFEDARQCLSMALEGSKEIGNDALTGYTHLLSARIFAGQGALEAAREDLNRAVELLQRANYRAPLFEAYVDCANLALQAGNLRGAAHALERAEQQGRAVDNRLLRVRLDRVSGLLARRQGRFSEAHEALRRSIELASRIKARYELGLSLLAMADVAELAPDKWPEAKTPEQLVAEAIPILRECGAEADLSRAFELQDRLRMIGRGESALARAIIDSGAPERHFEAGTLIIAEGESGHEMFLIRSGIVRVYRGSGADEFTLGLLGAGDFFGEMSIIGSTTRSASVRAVTNVVAVSVDKQKFDEVVSDPVAREIIGRMGDRMRELAERAEDLSKLDRDAIQVVPDSQSATAREA